MCLRKPSLNNYIVILFSGAKIAHFSLHFTPRRTIPFFQKLRDKNTSEGPSSLQSDLYTTSTRSRSMPENWHYNEIKKEPKYQRRGLSGEDTYDVPEINKACETRGGGRMKVSSGFNQHAQNTSSPPHITCLSGMGPAPHTHTILAPWGTWCGHTSQKQGRFFFLMILNNTLIFTGYSSQTEVLSGSHTQCAWWRVRDWEKRWN